MQGTLTLSSLMLTDHVVLLGERAVAERSVQMGNLATDGLKSPD